MLNFPSSALAGRAFSVEQEAPVYRTVSGTMNPDTEENTRYAMHLQEIYISQDKSLHSYRMLV
ncbi:hypothetical protein FC91_GL000887 [Schleiferilactobacillus harbinensis DSM 16991]|jgi:hypothetical protein|uniref:Uncharacterized protein n=1 Tax=Schleiferilactobacillus harbinensis DSM 16991 TaxID=1122147 RepID=A0A0R1XIC4_9LACO|nr:hypothetical protein FC91_GL000887 [Schleiferilactobacillus harbinensis DSM 16991]